MLRVIFELHPDNARWDKAGGRKIRTFDILEYSHRYDSGDYAYRYYVNDKHPDHDFRWVKGAAMGLPYHKFNHDYLVFLILKKHLKDRGYDV